MGDNSISIPMQRFDTTSSMSSSTTSSKSRRTSESVKALGCWYAVFNRSPAWHLKNMTDGVRNFLCCCRKTQLHRDDVSEIQPTANNAPINENTTSGRTDFRHAKESHVDGNIAGSSNQQPTTPPSTAASSNTTRKSSNPSASAANTNIYSKNLWSKYLGETERKTISALSTEKKKQGETRRLAFRNCINNESEAIATRMDDATQMLTQIRPERLITYLDAIGSGMSRIEDNESSQNFIKQLCQSCLHDVLANDKLPSKVKGAIFQSFTKAAKAFGRQHMLTVYHNLPEDLYALANDMPFENAKAFFGDLASENMKLVKRSNDMRSDAYKKIDLCNKVFQAFDYQGERDMAMPLIAWAGKNKTNTWAARNICHRVLQVQQENADGKNLNLQNLDLSMRILTPKNLPRLTDLPDCIWRIFCYFPAIDLSGNELKSIPIGTCESKCVDNKTRIRMNLKGNPLSDMSTNDLKRLCENNQREKLSPEFLIDENLRYDPYKVLGLERGATSKEITAAYKRLALEYHPDKSSSSTSNLSKEEADKKFKEIADAYASLKGSLNFS
jgi:hypothetical protein